MATMGRDERRRRIMERGSDRLALITGELKNLERMSSLPSTAPSLSFNERSSGSSEIRYDNPGSETPKKEATIVTKHVPKLEKPDTKPQSSSKPKQAAFLSSRRLNACIIASEVTRAKCSFVVTVLVLLCHSACSMIRNDDQPSNSDDSFWRPVYLIMATSLTIVLLRMIQGKEIIVEDAQEHAQEQKAGDNTEDKNWRDAFMTLERGLTAYQAVRGLFIDCSIYLIVVISGLSLA